MLSSHISISAAGCFVFAVSLSALAMSATADDAQLALGRKVFTEVGPNLDTLKPDVDRVMAAITQGIGAMPANEVLSEEQIKAVARYVSSIAGKAN